MAAGPFDAARLEAWHSAGRPAKPSGASLPCGDLKLEGQKAWAVAEDRAAFVHAEFVQGEINLRAVRYLAQAPNRFRHCI